MNDIEKDFERAKKWFFIYGGFLLIISLGLLAFSIWIIIVLLQFFGVI